MRKRQSEGRLQKFFNRYKEILKAMTEVAEERKPLGFITTFEHAIDELLLEITRGDERFSNKITKKIF